MTSENTRHFEVKTLLSEDGQSVRLTFSLSGKTVFDEELNTELVEKLNRDIGQIRKYMNEPVPNELPDGFKPLDEYNPRWFLVPDTKQEFPVLCLRHSGHGWLYFGIPRHEAREISRYLRTVPKINKLRDTVPPSASSIEGGGIFVSTHTTGNYYIGTGDAQLEAAVFEQIEWDSDRSAGIVAASMLEQRIEETLKAISHEQSEAAAMKLFGGNSPLGAFAPKIDLARFLGLISDDAHEDAHTIRKIRNDFAHNLQLDSFRSQSIYDRCMNLRLVENSVGPPETEKALHSAQPLERPKHYEGRSDYKKILSDPRSRYVFTVHLVCFALGQATTTQSNLKKPII